MSSPMRDTGHCFVKSEEFPKIVCNVQMYFQNIFNKLCYLEVFGYLLKNHGASCELWC